MKTLSKLTLFTLLLSTLTTHAYIPDLFGAYQRGANQAQYENQRDAYYYEQLNSHKFFFEVHDGKQKKAKNNFNLSPKNGDVLCWGVYNLENGNVAQSQEIIAMPYQGEFMGQSHNTNIQTTTNAIQLNASTVAFSKNLLSTNNQIYTCWVFNPYNTPKGRYTISIEVGSRNFGTKGFNIID